MDPHPLANLFKRSNYDEPIASEFCALDYLYEALLKNCESKNYDEEIYEEIHDNSLNKKHDFNDFPINSLDANCVGNVVISKNFLRTRKIMVIHSSERGECVHVPS